MKTFWDDRYANKEYAYGIEPNVFFKLQIDNLTPGRILLPLEGEGRNAVYAAKKGWEVHAFDFSKYAKHKAEQLAQLEAVSINYAVSNVMEYYFGNEEYDVVGLFYSHLPPSLLSHLLNQVKQALKSNGLLLLEAFSKDQLQYTSGGPKNKDMLFSETQLQSELSWLNISLLTTQKIVLQEGQFHQGPASVIRLVGKKN